MSRNKLPAFKMLVLWWCLVGIAAAELTLVPGRLSIDGILWGDAIFWQGSAQGWSKSGFEFQRRLALLGLSGAVTEPIDMRLEFDFSQVVLRDIFVDFRFRNGFLLRAGQFKLPLSFEFETPEGKLKLDDYSLLYLINITKPVDSRDIGLMVSYVNPCSETSAFRVMAMVVNGTGPNVGDDNSWKDVCVRAVFRPWLRDNYQFAGRYYYGWRYGGGAGWMGLGAEAVLTRGCFSIQSELAARRYLNKWAPGGYFQVTGDFGLFEPAVRGEIIRWEDDKFQWRVLSGLGFKFAGERLKVIFGYQYHTLIPDWTYKGIILQLQAVL